MALQPHARVATDREKEFARLDKEKAKLMKHLKEERSKVASLTKEKAALTKDHQILYEKNSLLTLMTEKDQGRIKELKEELVEKQARLDKLAPLEEIDLEKEKKAAILAYQKSELKDLMVRIRQDGFAAGLAKGIERCKRQINIEFPDSALPLNDMVIESSDEEEEGGEEEEEGGDEGGDDVLITGSTSKRTGEQSGEGGQSGKGDK